MRKRVVVVLAVACLLVQFNEAARRKQSKNNKGKNASKPSSTNSGTVEERLDHLEKLVQSTQNSYKSVISSLARQVLLQQQYVEEMTRSSGDSGLKQLRTNNFGTRPYYSTSFTGRSVASIHDHSNNIRTCGMGEFAAVLNGVEFRTRHNDYRLNMPSTKTKNYGEFEPIPFPGVPATVLNQKTVNGQIEEMRKWFKAWKDQDYSTRDYRKFFKPVLCYLEGMWTIPNQAGKVDEPFFSDRHSIDAASWFDLQDKIRFTSLTGRKSTKENYAFLPTTITALDEFGMPKYAQWNYKILCHPLKQDVPLSRFKIVDDLGTRVSNGKTLEDFQRQRAARFQVYPDIKFTGVFKQDHQTRGNSFLDKLMSEIPGKDNYKADIVDDAFNSTVFDVDTKVPPTTKINEANMPPALNAGYYHRNYKIAGKDAMGLSTRTRGFADASLYVALNTQPKIAPAAVNSCKRKKCSTWKQRVSYAIPLEIVYMTPLNSWNPYNLGYSDNVQVATTTNTTKERRRNGGQSPETAYYGTASRLYYRTPVEFFAGTKTNEKDPADTVKGSVGVLDKNGLVRRVTASGIRTTLPNIPGVGMIRQRYPIMPITQAGNFIYKEVEAVKDVLMKASQYRRFYPNQAPFGLGTGNGTANFDEVFTFELSTGAKTPPGPHTHTVELTTSDLRELRNKKMVYVTTTETAGHTHEIGVMYTSGVRKQKPYERVYIRECDGARRACWDGHKGTMTCLDCIVGSNVLPPSN